MEIRELMRILLYSMTNYIPYWRKFPYLGLKTGYWATCKLEAMRFSVKRKYKCYQLKETVSRICGFFCLIILTLDVEKRVKQQWTASWWTYLHFAVISSRQVSQFDNILWFLGPSSKCFAKKNPCELSWAMFIWRWEEPCLVLLSHKSPVHGFPPFLFPK